MFHETFNVLQAAVRLVAEPLGDFGLPVKAQSIITALGQKMQMTAHRPEEALAFFEHREFVAREYALLCQLIGRLGGVQELGNPEQRVEVT